MAIMVIFMGQPKYYFCIIIFVKCKTQVYVSLGYRIKYPQIQILHFANDRKSIFRKISDFLTEVIFKLK